MTTTHLLRDGADSAHSYTEDALSTAHDALAKASDTVRDLRSTARDFTSRSLDTVAETASAAQKRLGSYVQATGRYAAEQPVKTALIAAAVGALVAGAIIAARRSSNR